MHRTGNFRIGSQQTQISIKTRGSSVVISSTKVRVAARLSIFVMPHQERKLAVSLEPDQAMEYLDSGIFKVACPANVRGLVKASLELNYGCDIFFFCRRDQCRHN